MATAENDKMTNDRPVISPAMVKAGEDALFRYRMEHQHPEDSFCDDDAAILVLQAALQVSCRD